MPRSTTKTSTRRSATRPSFTEQDADTARMTKRTTSTPTEGPLAEVRTPTDHQPMSRLDQLVALLRHPDGASLSELAAATGWQAHSVRGAIAGSLKRKGHVVTSHKRDGVRRYRIGALP